MFMELLRQSRLLPLNGPARILGPVSAFGPYAAVGCGLLSLPQMTRSGPGFGNFRARLVEWKCVRPDGSPESSGITSSGSRRAKWRPEAPPFQIRSGVPVQPEPPLWRLP